MTKLTIWTAGQLFAMLALGVKNMGVGAITLEYAPRNNSSISAENDEGWRPLGILGNDVEIKPILESFEAMAGSSANLMGDALTSKKVEVDITLMAPRPRAIALSNTNQLITYKEPDTPITTTVDLTTATAFEPDHKRIRVASVTGLLVGQQIAMLTGNSTYGTEYEVLTITEINATTKVLTFGDDVYFQHPEHGATVKVITGIDYEFSGTVLPQERLRLVKYNNGNNSVTIIPLDNVFVSPTNKKLGMKNPSEVSLKLKVVPNATITVNDDTSPTVEYKHFQELVRFNPVV